MNLSEWNERLIQAVFSGDTGHGPIRIINATDGFLAHVAELPQEQGAAAREDLIVALKSVPYGIRGLFDRDDQMSLWRRRPGPPTFFAQLYLSLIAASATEDTHDEGDFRRRYARLLGLEPGNYVSNGLPRLWEVLAAWSAKQAASGSGMRRLVLPDPGFETIIGYAKRLAFPGYRDMEALAAVLTEENLTAESPAQAIVNALGGNLRRFSPNFVLEYDLLCKTLKTKPGEVFLLPLWAAVEAATFEPQMRGVTQRAKHVLQVDADEFGRLAAHLFTNHRPLKQFASICEVLADRSVGGCGYQIQVRGGTGGRGLLLALLDDGSSLRDALGQSPIRRHLIQDCLAFVPDDDGVFAWRASMPNRGPARFLCRREPRRILERVGAGRFGPQLTSEVVDGANGWIFVRVNDCSVLRDNFIPLDRIDRYDAFSQGVAVPRLTIRNGVKVLDGLMLNSGARFRIAAHDCDQVSVQLHPDQDSISLEAVIDTGEYRLTYEQIEALSLPATIAFRGARDGEIVTVRQVHISRDPPETRLQPQGNSLSYLEECAFGQLAAPGSWGSLDTESQLNPNASVAGTFIPTACLSDGPSLQFVEMPRSSRYIDRWKDLVDALHAQFLNAESLDDERLSNFTEGVRDIDLKLSHFAVSTLLWHMRVVEKRWVRRYRGARYFPINPHLSFDPGTGAATLIGLNSRHIESRLRQIADRKKITLVGCIPFSIAAFVPKTVAEEMAKEMDLSLRITSRPPAPKLSEVVQRLPLRYRDNRDRAEVKYWSSKSAAFVDEQPSQMVTLARKYFERSQAIYEVLGDGEVIWATESRAWALLIFNAMSGVRVATRSAATIFSNQPLPVCVADAAVRSGGLVALETVQPSIQWRYTFGSVKSCDDFLFFWMTSNTGGNALQLERWARSLDQGTRGIKMTRALTRRYVR